MAIQKSTGAPTDSLNSSVASASALIDAFETDLVAAGWTITSGSGTDDIMFQSAANNNSRRIKVNIFTNSTQVRMTLWDNAELAGAESNAGAWLDCGATRDWRIIANEFGFCVYNPGSQLTAGRWAMAQNLYIPTEMQGTVTGDTGFLTSNSAAIGSGTFRGELVEALNAGNAPHSVKHTLYNGTRAEINNNGNTHRSSLGWKASAPEMNISGSGPQTHDVRWINGDYVRQDALVGWGAVNGLTQGDNGRIIGLVYDYVIIFDELAYDDEFTIDSDDYRVVGRVAATTTLPPYAAAMRIT